MAHTDMLERWLKDPFQPEIKLAWEVLPTPSGVPHLVDPDPDSYQFAELLEKHPEYSVSLCGKTLVAKGGSIEPGDICVVCLELSKERQAEFDAERGYVP
jgi:hypothetical protein